MRIAAVLACLSAFAACGASGEPAPDLKGLYEGRQWFRLREAVLSVPNAPLFYRAVVALAFHDDEGAERMFEEVVRAAPDSWEAGEAKRLRTGFRRRSGRESNQSVVKKGASRIRYRMKDDHVYIPLAINGRRAIYVLDTGAAGSLVSESEARRLGLKLHKVDGTGFDGMTGRKDSFHYTGIARRISIGSTELRNARFFVLPDDTFYFKGRAPGENGILGLPQIQALGTVRWDANGNFDIGFPSAPREAATPNLAFEGDDMDVEVGFQKHRLIFRLDTGAQESELYVGFRNQFAELVNASGKREKRTAVGLGAKVEEEAIMLPELRLQAGGLETLLQPAPMTLNEALGAGHHGNLGLDLLNQARVVTIDFRNMLLRLEGRRPDVELQSLFASNQWYKLREAAARPTAPAFYRGAAGCAFNDASACEQDLRAAIDLAADSELAYAARAFLTYHYSRTGRPRQALEQLREMHKQKPDAADINGALGVFAVLGRFPDQRVAKRAPSRIPFTADGLVVPVIINGRQADYSLDPSSPWNVIGESEAKRLGLATRRTNGEWPGAQSVANASRLTVGKVELWNVAFLVYRDDQAGPRGRLGLPVLLALGAIRWSNDGTLEIGLPSVPGTTPNLRFDGYALVAQAGVGPDAAELSFNPAAGTRLFRKFRQDFPALANAPELKLRLGGFDVVLRNPSVVDDDSPYDGTLGMDLLRQARRVTLDLKSMTLQLSD